MCGRIGAIVGNVIFGALVDEYCVVPIYMFGTLLISKCSCTVKKKKYCDILLYDLPA